MQNNTQTPTLGQMNSLKTRLNVLVDEDLKPKQKTVYNSKIDQLRNDLDEAGISKDLTLREAERALEKWIELLSQTQETVTEVPRPEGLNNTTLTSDQLENLEEQADKQKRKYDQTVKNQKEAVAKFKEAGEKRYQDQQKAEALKEKQTQELLNQFFKAKVVVVPTEEIPEVKLSKENKEALIAAETAAKEDPATTKKVFEEKIQVALKSSDSEYQIIDKAVIEKSAVHLVETLRSLPDYKNIDEIPDTPKSLNTLSILNPLSDPNSEVMIKIIPDKEAREKFAREVQTLMLTTEAERTVNIAGANAIFGEVAENIIYSLYGPDTITNFQISTDEKDKDEGVEISPRDVYEKGRQISDFINKVKGARNVEEVTSTGLAYYPTYSYSNAAVATKTTLALTKALPMAGAVYGFRQGTLLAHWAKYNTPLLTGGGSVPFLTAGGVQNTVLMSNSVTGKILFSKNFATGYSVQVMQFAKETNTLYTAGATFGNKAFGVYVGQAGGKIGAGTIVAKASGEVVVKAGLATTLSTTLAAWGASIPVPILNAAIAAVGWAIGSLLGKLADKLMDWWTRNKDNLGPALAVGLGFGGLMIGGPGVGLAGLGLGLAATGSLGAFAAGAFGVLGFIGRSVGIAIATPVIVTLLVIPPLVAFIMLVINNSAYVVPPDAKSLGINIDNPYILITKVASPDKIDNPTSGTTAVTYTVTIKALKSALTNLSITEATCKVSKKNASTVLPCPDELENIPPIPANLTISPSSSYTFTFISEFDSKYTDTSVFDTIKIKGDSAEEVGIETSASESVCIGDCPHGCFEISNNSEAWSKNPNAAQTLESATLELISKFPNFVDKACSGSEKINLCYTTKDPSPVGDGLCINNIYAIHKHTDSCDINFNQCSLDGDAKDALFLLTHELGHHIEQVDGNMLSRFRDSGARLGLCSYSGTNGDESESAAESMALYANGGVASFSTCSMNFISQYPRNYTFAKDYMNNP